MCSLKRYTLILVCSITFCQAAYTQTNWVADSLSVLNERIRIAQSTNDNEAALRSYFGNTFSAISSWTSNNEDFNKITNFILEGISFAQSANEHDYASIGYTRMASILRKRSDFDHAIRNAFLAISDFEKIESDSVKAIAYIEIADCYQKKTELVNACKYFNDAFELALTGGYPILESTICHRLANLYYLQGDTSEAKRQIYKSVIINKEYKNGGGLIDDYTALGRVTDNPRYLDTVFTLAHSLGLEEKTFKAKSYLLLIYGFVYMDAKRALDYINAEPDIKEDLMKGGIANYYFFLGQLYRYGNMPDSGLMYLEKAAPALIKDFGKAKDIYLEKAICYELIKDWKNAIHYYEKAIVFSKDDNDLSNIALVSNALSKLYNQKGDYKKAYEYKLIATEIGDSLTSAAKQKKLVLLDLDRETKKHEEDVRREKERLVRKHNMQYIGITIALCFVFLCFLVIGMFPVSKLMIRIFGFISFICLFEFVILLIEHSVLHPITHGDPLKLWLLKIVLIALLVPFQQFLEHRLIKFVQSRKLHEARKRMAGKWGRKKKPALKTEVTGEPGSE